MPPKIWAFRDRVDLVLDLSVGRVPYFTVRIVVVASELTTADETFYLIPQVKARRGRVTVNIVEQAKFVLVLL